MKIYSGRNIKELSLEDFLGKDVWVRCETIWGFYYVRVLKIYDDLTLKCNTCSIGKRNFSPEDLDIYCIIGEERRLAMKLFEVKYPIDTLTTEELLEPIAESQGIDLEEILKIDREF